MIKFPCKCGHAFNVTEDQAGGLVQCPRCGLLADIPTLSDIPNMENDGTFVFQTVNAPVNNVTAADLHRVFTNKTTDRHGVEKDLRPTAERLAAVGSQEHKPVRIAPRYDPVTGELITPLQLKDEQPVPVLAIATAVDETDLTDEEVANIATPVIPITGPVRPHVKSLSYATGETRRRVTLKTLGFELLMPGNTVVMFFVFVLYVAAFYTTSAVASYSERFLQTVWPFLFLNVPMWMILSHFGCVIEDIGPNAIDELPRPLRNFELGDDLLTPTFRVLLATCICFVPAAMLYHGLNPDNPMSLPIILTFAAVGSFCYPAVLLTSVAGTTVLNLRPDRIGGVIKACGISYPISVVLFVLAAVPSVYYVAGELLFRLMFTASFFRIMFTPMLSLPLILVSVYLTHIFLWHLGLMYREHHEMFPWIAQRHIKIKR